MAVVAIVKYTSRADDLAWRFPSEGLGTWTKLIVNEPQEAIIVKDGQALDVFVPGQHVLSTGNIPLLNKLLNLPDDKHSPLAVDIWYVNKRRILEIKWGTPAPIEVSDSKYKAFIPLRAFGQFSIQVREPTTFLNNFLGRLPALDNDSLIKYFKGLYLGRLKENMISYIKEKDISVLEIGTYLEELSERLKVDIMPILDECSVRLIDFRLNNIKLSEDNPVVKQMNAALAKKAVAELVGSEYIQEHLTEQPATVSNADLSEFVGMPEQVIEQEQDYKVPIIKTCPVCYNDLEKGVRYCRECNYDTTGNGSATSISEAVPETKDSLSEEPEITKKCPGCLNDMEINCRFCSVCGCDTKEPTPVIAKSRTPEPSPVMRNNPSEPEKPIVKKCSSCGTQLRAKQKFCHRCGGKS